MRFGNCTAGLALLFSGAAAPALAADLPVAPEPIDYVRVCDAFGNRFHYIPGTDTCLRVGGRIRAEARINNFGSAPSNWSDRTSGDGVNFRARGYLYLDSRTNTEYGLLRTYTSMFVTANGPAETVSLEYGYIQFGGFTAGHAQSFFDFWTGYSYGAQVTDYTDTKTNLFAYTAAFGNGFSATVSIEDGRFRRTSLVSPGVDTQATQTWPDLVGALRVEQGWGTAQIMGAIHDVRFVDTTSKGAVGWAIGAGVELKVPVFGQSDKVVVQVAYSDGASRYVLDSWDGRITDAIRLAGSSTKTTKTWNASAGFRHVFTDSITGNLEGGYHNADAAGSAHDFNQWGITGNMVWSPVAGFGIGAELQYRRVDYNAASGLSDKDEIYSTIRVQRTF